MYILNMNMEEFAEKKQTVKTAIIPIGMVEAHGRHCPLGTDMLIPREFMERVEAEMGERVFIAPEIPYGHSWALAPFPGTLSIPSAVFGEYVYHIGLELGRWGISRLLFFNGHGGNIPALTTVCERLADQGITSMMLNWWQDFRAEILSVCTGQGHGGEDETSAILAINQNLVDMRNATANNARTVAKVFYAGMEADILPDAMTGDATLASREKGKMLFQLLLPRLRELLQDLEDGTLAVK